MGALDGIRVIDFGQYISGPLAGMLLADQGADVVKVDPPGGPAWKTPANRTWNRGKRSIVLDLKTEQGQADAKRLVAGADVVIENFRPGVMDRLGLGAEAMTAANPRLIYCSIPGFASDDERAGLKAWEGVVSAAAATYAGRGERPVYTALPATSGYGAFVSVVSIAMALNARERDGVGQRIEVPLFAATYQALGLRGQRIHSTGAPGLAEMLMPWVRQYECADGRWVQFHAANTRFIHQFMDAAGVSSWRDEGLDDRAKLMANPELNRDLFNRMVALFKTKTAQEWEDLVNAAGTPTAICRDTAEWLVHPHAIESKMVVTLEDPELGTMKQPGIQVRMSETSGAIRGPAPKLDAHRIEVLSEARPAPQAPQAPASPVAEAMAALDGIRVIDLCIILAGPTCGRTLAEFGADVIKIDNPNREGGVAFHMDVNRGKRTILVDLEKPEGQEIFWALAEKADVIVQNYRQGSIKKLGVDYESVAAKRPDIVYASLNAYGDIGPWSRRPGWEQLAQAATGMQKRYGGDGQPVLQPFPVNDYGTGFMGAYGVALALLHKRKTGKGQHVQTALARTASTLQSVFFNDFEGKTWDEPRGQDALGDGPLNRLYQASDGWFFLAATPKELAGIESAVGATGLASLPGSDLERCLEERFVAGTRADWIERLRAAGAGAYEVITVEQMMADPWARAHGQSLSREHDVHGMVTHIGPAPMLSRTPVQPGCPAPRPGADALSVLSEIGMAGELERLVACGAVVTEGVQGR